VEPTQIYAGRREAMQAEIGTLPCYGGKFLVQLTGGGNWDANGFSTIKEARAEVAALREEFPGISVCWLF
jgi:hypothetical protein